MTKKEQTKIESRCRAALRKQGRKLEKKREVSFSFYPQLSRYRIIIPGNELQDGYPLRLHEVMEAAGLA